MVKCWIIQLNCVPCSNHFHSLLTWNCLLNFTIFNKVTKATTTTTTNKNSYLIGCKIFPLKLSMFSRMKVLIFFYFTLFSCYFMIQQNFVNNPYWVSWLKFIKALSLHFTAIKLKKILKHQAAARYLIAVKSRKNIKY